MPRNAFYSDYQRRFPNYFTTIHALLQDQLQHYVQLIHSNYPVEKTEEKKKRKMKINAQNFSQTHINGGQTTKEMHTDGVFGSMKSSMERFKL